MRIFYFSHYSLFLDCWIKYIFSIMTLNPLTSLIHLLNLIFFLDLDLDFLGTKIKSFENNDSFIFSIFKPCALLSFVCPVTLVRTFIIVCNFLSCNVLVRFWNQSYPGLRKGQLRIFPAFFFLFGNVCSRLMISFS